MKTKVDVKRKWGRVAAEAADEAERQALAYCVPELIAAEISNRVYRATALAVMDIFDIDVGIRRGA